MRSRCNISDSKARVLGELEHDVIEVDGTPHYQPRRGLRPPMVGHWRIKTLSVSGGKQHTVRLNNVSAVPEDEDIAAGMVFGVRRNDSSIGSEHYAGGARVLVGVKYCRVVFGG